MSALTDITVQVHDFTVDSVLVSTDGERTNAVWLLFSAIEISGRRGSAVAVDITLLESLAIEKGLV